MQETFNIYFSGQLMKGQDPAEVREKIGAMFKLQGEKLERLFSGTPIAIKKDVDMDQAVKYRLAFRQAGALVDIQPVNQPPVNPPSAIPQPPGTAQTQTDTVESGLTLSAPEGFDLSDCTPVQEAAEIPDISGLGLDKPGVTLDQQATPEPLQINTEALQLAEPGPLPEQAGETFNTDIDTSGLTLSAANEGSLEDCQQPVQPLPIPDITHLHLEEQEQEEDQKQQDPVSGGRASFVISEE